MYRLASHAVCYALLATLVACGGGGGGGGNDPDPPTGPNSPPTIGVPAGLSGSSPSYGLTLPTGDSRTLLFTSSDPDGDLMQWQVAGSGPGAVAAGVTFTAPIFGSAFQIQVAPVASPAVVTLSILVEDPDGAASAIDLRIVRSGLPVITSITPNSAFATRAQKVNVTGSALLLGNAVNTTLAFDGLQAGSIVVANDTTITANTPTSAAIGDTVVSVANVFGSTSLPGAAFRMHTFPPDLFSADARIDAGSASSLVVARDRDVIAAAWLEGASLVYRVSNDRGANWSSPVTLSGAEAATEPCLTLANNAVMVAWIGDGTSVRVRRSTNGGSVFEAVQRVDTFGSVVEARRPRLAQSGDNRYLAWLSGNVSLGTSRLQAVASSNAGVAWNASITVASGGQNQQNHELACDGAIAWLLFEDDRVAPRAAWVTRTTDGGSTWQAGLRLNSLATAASSPVLTASTDRVYAAWVQNGGLFLSTSADRGATWATTIVELQGPQSGNVTQPMGVCDATHALFTYIVGGTIVRTSRFTPSGASVQQATLDATAAVSASPRLALSGNYAFVTWREGDVGSGAARTNFAVSVNSASSFETATGLGDGAAAQDLPVLGIEGAHVFFAWLDLRGATSGVFTNRTEF